MTSRERTHVKKQLATQGLRLASTREPGWYVPVELNGESVSVWATDAPALTWDKNAWEVVR